MKGSKIKKLFPDFAKKYKIQNSDELYLCGDKIKVLKEGSIEPYGNLKPEIKKSVIKIS